MIKVSHPDQMSYKNNDNSTHLQWGNSGMNNYSSIILLLTYQYVCEHPTKVDVLTILPYFHVIKHMHFVSPQEQNLYLKAKCEMSPN